MKKQTFQTPWNYNPEGKGEEVKGESMTVQGDAYSIQELLMKFSTGQIVDVKRNGQYGDSESFDDIDLKQVNDADIFERHQVLIENQALIKQKRAWLEQERLKREEQKKSVASTTDPVV